MTTVKNNFIWLNALILMFAIASCGGGHEVELAKDTRPTVQAKLVKAGGTTSEGYITISGKIQAKKHANVAARIMGNIIGTNAKIGDRVQAGQLLATISSTDMQAKLAQAEAGIQEAKTGLANIEKDYARINSLFQKNSATQKELDDISAHRDMMKAKVKRAEEMKKEINTMISYAKIKAPFSGTVTEKYADVGDLASPGKPLFTIESNGGFQAEAMIPESQITNVKKGDRVKVLIKSSGQEINGTISELSSSALNTGGQYLTKINLDNKDVKNIKLYSGMYINVLLPNKNKSDKGGKITVNKNAIVQQGQLTGIYTMSGENTAILRWVRLGKTYGDQVEVLSGLASGESYIADANGRLVNGVKVEIK